MYLPEHFAETRIDELHRLIREQPLGALVRSTPQGLDADHIPFELDAARGPVGTLQAHVARANPLALPIGEGMEVLVIFRGHHGYISPNWYPSKHESHQQVPTWNYEVVHAHGRLRVLDDEKFVAGLLARLTRRHEAGEPRPWRMGDAPRDYLQERLRAVVGIEVEITRLEGKRKLSQNREPRDIDGAVSVLRERGMEALAESMARERR